MDMNYDKHLERIAKGSSRLTANRADVLINVGYVDNHLVATDTIEILRVKDTHASGYTNANYTNVKTNEILEHVNYPSFDSILNEYNDFDSNELLSVIKKSELSELKAFAKGATAKHAKLVHIICSGKKLEIQADKTNEVLLEIEFKTSSATSFSQVITLNVKRLIKMLEFVSEFQRSDKDEPIYFLSPSSLRPLFIKSSKFIYAVAPVKPL